jgi:hypothetical protein
MTEGDDRLKRSCKCQKSCKYYRYLNNGISAM